jgi:hypothetical protein
MYMCAFTRKSMYMRTFMVGWSMVTPKQRTRLFYGNFLKPVVCGRWSRTSKPRAHTRTRAHTHTNAVHTCTIRDYIGGPRACARVGGAQGPAQDRVGAVSDDRLAYSGAPRATACRSHAVLRCKLSGPPKTGGPRGGMLHLRTAWGRHAVHPVAWRNVVASGLEWRRISHCKELHML